MNIIDSRLSLYSQFFALALSASFISCSLSVCHQIFYKRMYHKTEKSTEKRRKAGEQNKFNGDTNLLSLIFLVYYFLPFTLFFPFVRLSFLFTDISRLTQKFFLFSGGKVTGISESDIVAYFSRGTSF